MLKFFPPKTAPELVYLLWESFNNPNSLKNMRASRKKKRQDFNESKESKESKEPPQGSEFTRVCTEIIDAVPDVATWLDTLWDKKQKGFMGLRDRHAFQLTRDQEDRELVLIRSKASAGDLDWIVSFAI